jgi:hypothetical protein
MCAPRVTRHTSIRYSSSCHTRINMGASIFFTAAMIHALGQRCHVVLVGRKVKEHLLSLGLILQITH